jgi:hypothetical protein
MINRRVQSCTPKNALTVDAPRRAYESGRLFFRSVSAMVATVALTHTARAFHRASVSIR